MTHDDGKLARRRAVEALRSGVPNRDAVALLGCNQPRAEAMFDSLLKRAADGGALDGDDRGMLVSGDFGTGKSHLLVHLERQALSRGFVCSKVAISKETPLYDLGKVFRTAVENARMPNRQGRLLEELGLAMDWKSTASARLFQWANGAASNGLLSHLFPASLLVYERGGDLEINGKIESFWAGDRILVSDIKNGLAQIGQKRTFGKFRAPRVAELPPQRLRFAAELIRSAGYRGWVVLLDEIELVGSYSILQRGRSYAELARWLGPVAGEAWPGLVVVGTVTDDFASAVISPDGKKKDRDYVAPRMRNSRYETDANLAETGMRLLERHCIPLEAATAEDVNATVERLREIYRDAYAWEAPPWRGDMGGASIQSRMRYKVRAAINEWDLQRIYPDARTRTVVKEFRPVYDENTDLERESDNDGGNAG